MLEVERRRKIKFNTEEEVKKNIENDKRRNIIVKRFKEITKISEDGKTKTTELLEEKTNLTKKINEEAKLIKQDNAKKIIEELEKIYKVK